MGTIREIIASLSGETLVNLVLLLPMACLSLILFLGYKSVCASYKNPKLAKIDYIKVLCLGIFVKSTIFVPLVRWLLDVVIFSSLDIGFFTSWLVWCAVLWSWRKFYTRGRKNNSYKLPTSFYNKK